MGTSEVASYSNHIPRTPVRPAPPMGKAEEFPQWKPWPCSKITAFGKKVVPINVLLKK